MGILLLILVWSQFHHPKGFSIYKTDKTENLRIKNHLLRWSHYWDLIHYSLYWLWSQNCKLIILLTSCKFLCVNESKTTCMLIFKFIMFFPFFPAFQRKKKKKETLKKKLSIVCLTLVKSLLLYFMMLHWYRLWDSHPHQDNYQQGENRHM